MDWLQPFEYAYMQNAILISLLVGTTCGMMSAFLVLKGWALIGDALSHAVVPGVACAAFLGLPFSIGALFAALLAMLSMLFLQPRTGLKQDAIIGMVFVSFFGFGLFLVSLKPLMLDIQTIMMGNILAIAPSDSLQLWLIGGLTMTVILLKWRDFALCFFNAHHAHAMGIRPQRLQFLFFILLSITTVAALQAVGAFLVVAMVIIPGATAYLLCDRFGKMLSLSTLIGAICGGTGAYISYFLDGATGGVIVLLQSFLFAMAFVWSRRHGLLSRYFSPSR